MQPHLSRGDILHGKLDYTIDHLLGAGGFGATYLANAAVQLGNISHQLPFTIKELTATEHEQLFLHEAQRLSKLEQHPGIVRVNEVFRQNNTVYYVMEYLGSQNLEDYAKKNGGMLNEQQATHIFRLVAQALDFLHSKHITHLDVKPANIMMRQTADSPIPTPVLIDFGLAVHYGKSGDPTRQHSTICCSDGYSPLEQYLGISSFSPTADIYALGATLFYMLTGEKPPVASEISDSVIEEKLGKRISPNLLTILKKCMSKLPETRYPTLAEMLAVLDVNTDIPQTAAGEEETEHTRVIGQKSRPSKAKKIKPDKSEGIKMPHVRLKSAIKREQSKSYAERSRLSKSAIFAAAAALVVGIIFLIVSKYNPTTNTTNEPTNITAADTSAKPIEQAAAPQTDAQQSESDKATTPTSAEATPTPIIQQQEKQNTISQTTEKSELSTPTDQKPAPEAEQKPDNNTLDLGYAHYSGTIQNGKPHGHGTLTFYATHNIETGDSEQRIANPGDKVTGKFVNGKLSFGRWTKSSGEVESLAIGN